MKLDITVNAGTLAGQSFDLQTGFMTIGRSEACTVRFDPLVERIASKQHAFIEARSDGFYISDNQSTNGTFVNGSRITTARLNNGDVIQFGSNGVTANVRIAESEVPAAVTREAQIEQFDDTVSRQPKSMQNSIASFGLGGAAPPKIEASKTGKYVGIGISLFLIVFLGSIVIGLMFLSVGPVAAVIAAVIAFLPAMVYILPIIWLDRYDPEPVWLLGMAFLWGALVAVVVSFIINTLVGAVVSMAAGPELGEIAGAVFSAPIVEEGSKGIGVVLLLIFFRRYFDDILDGIVFAGVIALGFATVENVLYYGRAVGAGDAGSVAVLVFLRGVLSPFAHVTFTSMTGIGCGISRESHNKIVKILMPILGYFGAVSLHALWNGMASVGGGGAFLIGYIVAEVPFFFIFVCFALYIMWRQHKIVKEMLAIDIARGLISPELAEKATSAFRSTGWILSGIFTGKALARSRYVRAVGKLGLSYWHIQRATRAHGETGSFQQNPILREEVLLWRDKV